jgi:aquaporin Z
MRKLIAECLGTFCLVFAGTGAVVVNAISGGAVTHVGVSLVFGLVVMAMIYAVGETSGAHLNPAVTLGFWASGRFGGRGVLPYVASQCLGAIGASLVVRFVLGNVAQLGATAPSGSFGQTFGLEVVLTAILMFVILTVSTGSRETGTMAGIAVGGVIGLEALMGGPISGASMNPARSLGPALVSGELRFLWVYVAATGLGSLVGVGAWRAVRARVVA